MSAPAMALPASDSLPVALKDKKTSGDHTPNSPNINSNTAEAAATEETPTTRKPTSKNATTLSKTENTTPTTTKTTIVIKGNSSSIKTSEVEAAAEDSTRTRSRPETRGRRALRCNHVGCTFSTTVSQEFTHHQNTAHTESKDREEASQDTPMRRASTRQKRSTSISLVDSKKPKADPKKVDIVVVKKASPAAAERGRSLTRKPSTNSASGEDLVISHGSTSTTTTPTSSKKLTVAQLSAANNSSCGVTKRIVAATPPYVASTSGAIITALRKDSANSKEPSTLDSAESKTTEEEKDTAAPPLEPLFTMISTSNGPMPQDMSGTSEDEHDLSEEGGRLIIDDSTLGNKSSLMLPTRCGNIQNRTYMCDECSYTTTSAQQSLRHQKNEHGHDFIIYECDICDYATKYKQKLPRHYKLHFPGTMPSSLLDVSTSSERSLSPHPPASSNPVVMSTPNPSTTALAPISFPIATPVIGASTPTSKRSASDAGFLPTTLSVLPAEVILEDGEDEDGDDVDDETNGSVTPPPDVAEGGDLLSVSPVAPPTKKKRKDVSPDKYFEVAEEVSSTKYGCAKCGNVYKWKKSLNKHWKEKHGGDPGDQKFTPPGMEILLQQNNHTQTEHRRCCHNTLLERITVKQRPSSNTSSRAETPQNFLNGHYGQDDEMDGPNPMGYMPTIPMGPFVLGTSSQPVFPNSNVRQSMIANLNAPIPSSTSSSSNVLDLSRHNGMDETDSVDDGAKPLDFSVQRSDEHSASSPATPLMSHIFSGHEATAEEDEEVSALNQLTKGSVPGKDILKCPKCGEVLKTQTAYSNHMAMHLHSSNKRVAKCGVCCKHFPNNDSLNVHFMDQHLDLIASHKEAIQKIPHGLQQTYHLLKMPLQNIPKLSNQETEDPLKCNMCDFTAKWPAELQKHAVSHSDERPFVCMVCGSTYKWKWDLVKHFEKAHSNLPNPYKRRDAGAASNVEQKATPEVPASAMSPHGHDGYEMEEGEIAPLEGKVRHGNGSVDLSNSFLFDQTSQSQDEISVENILRTSQQASLMMSRQPNFLDGPDDPQLSSSSTSPRPDLQSDAFQILDVRSLQGMNLPTNSGLLSSNGDPHSGDDDASRPIRLALARNIQRRQIGAGMPYPLQNMRPKPGGKPMKASYKGYKTVENSESSDLKYQCVLCDYKARWPSEIMQHMKNHSSEKPYGCPNCTYRSKWKWDVVKHLKRCGGGTIKDVIDYSSKPVVRDAPPNVMVTPEGGMVQSQQAVSPAPSSGEEGGPTLPQLPGLTGDGPASFLQAPPYLVSMPTSAAAVASAAASAYSNVQAQALVNAHLIFQRIQAATEANNSASADHSSSPSPTPSAQREDGEPQQQPPPVVFNSLINEGQHHCLLCTFVANSPAELRRHQVLHSDEKPFMCDECGYCTKWKCDMKKHKEKYKHNGPIKFTRPDANGQDVFESDSKDALQTKNLQAEQGSSGKKSPSLRAKFQCKNCPFTTNELGDFISHRRKHQGDKAGEESRHSPVPNAASDMDEARLKHPRKAMKKYTCPKCSFVCVKSTELLEHQRQAHGSHRCPFCSQSFEKKDSFLDHLIIHPEFNSKEWEHFFMHESENEEDVNNNRGQEGNNSVSVMDTGSSANTIDLTSRNTPPPLLLANAPSPALDHNLPCEWCEARFANVVRLYHHVLGTHPSQVREQEAAEGVAMPAAGKQSSLPSKELVNSANATGGDNKVNSANTTGGDNKVNSANSTGGDNKVKTHNKKGKRSPSPAKVNGKIQRSMEWAVSDLIKAPTIVAQLGQPQVLQLPSQLATTSATASSKPEMGLNLSTKKSPFTDILQCSKCSFKTLSMEKYRQHYMEHIAAEKQLAQIRGSSKNAHSKNLSAAVLEELRCWFCGDLQTSYLEVFQHMQDKHPKKLNDRPRQKDALVQKIVQEMHSKTSPLKAKPAKTSLLNTQQSPAAATSSRDHQVIASKIPSSWLRQKKVHTYKGTPLAGYKMGSELWYKCIMCNFMDHNPAQVCNHTLKVHRDLPHKYQCNHCPESSEQLQQLLKHQQLVHSDQQPDMTVLTYEELTLPLQKQPDAAALIVHSCKSCTYKSRTKQEMDLHTSTFHSSPPTYVCDHCPYTTTILMDVYEHTHNHDNTGNPNPMGFKIVSTSAPAPAAPADVPVRTIKQEPASFSPPQASTPVHGPFESTPLDLTAETDHSSDKNRSSKETSPVTEKSACSVENMETDQDVAPIEKAAAATKTEKEVQKNAEAKTGGSKASTEGGEKPTRVYKCKHCPFSSGTSFEFRTHCSFHGLKGRYQCDHCSYSHQELENLVHHRQLHSEEPGFSPEYNPPPSQEEESQEEDSGSPGSASPLQETLHCPECPYRANARKTFSQHVDKHGSKLPFICDFCDLSANLLVTVVEHRMLHDDEPDFKPTPKDDSLVNQEYPKDHVTGEFQAKLLDSRSVEETTQSAPADAQSPPFKLSITKKLYSCAHCPYVSGNRGAYDFHQALHGGSGCYTCEQCSYRTQRWSLLLQHGRLHDEQSKVALTPTEHDDTDSGNHDSSKASKTDKSEDDKGDDSPSKEAPGNNSSSASDYGSLTNGDSRNNNNNNNNNNSSGSSGSEMQCQRCPYSTTSRLALNQHTKHHSGPGEAACPCCDYACASKDQLLVHVQVHFPSAIIDMDSLQGMLTTHKKAETSSLKEGKNLVSKVKEEKNADEGKDCAEKVGEESKEGDGEQKPCRVYACRYCEREFQEKNLMIQHERQHQG